jgi:N6-adenosine-specific RNA methylase IME4
VSQRVSGERSIAEIAAGYEAHPAAEVLPLLEGEEFEALVADVRAHGLINPITLLKGRILDGRNRYWACLAAEVEPRFVEFAGGDPIAFIISVNVKRRHLDESQRAMVAARLETMTHGGARRSDQDANLHLEMSRQRAAGLVNVSARSVASAREVLDHGEPDLVRAVDQGEIAVSLAVQLLRQSPETQIEAARAPALVKQKLRAARRDEVLRRIVDANPALPTGTRYPGQYSDPPLRDEFGPSDHETERHYPTMTEAELVALAPQIAEMTSADAIHFMWAAPHLFLVAARILDAWGFPYRTHIVWRKPRAGLGQYLRSQHECLLIGRRGAMPTPFESDRVGSVIDAPLGAHSAKPAIFAELIEAWYPLPLARIELFRRGPPRPGWKPWGNEAKTAAE